MDNDEKNESNGLTLTTVTNNSVGIQPPITESIKITTPVTTPTDTTRLSSPSLSVQNLNLADQPIVAAQIGDKKILNIKLVSPASCVIGTTTSKTSNISPVINAANTVLSEKLNQDLLDQETAVVAVDDDSNASTKFSREHKQLQDSINSSKVLTEYFIEVGRSRNRRKSTASVREESKSPGRISKPRTRSASRSTRSSSRTPNILDRTQSPSADSLKLLEANSSASQTSKRKSQKRINMRSSNVEFIQKQQQFLQKVHAQDDSGEEESGDDDVKSVKSTKCSDKSTVAATPKNELPAPPKVGSDRFCWRCFHSNQLIACSKCVRSYHVRCMKINQVPTPPYNNKWKCPECVELETIEKLNKGKPKFDKDFLHTLLNLVYNRMVLAKGVSKFNTICKSCKFLYIFVLYY